MPRMREGLEEFIVDFVSDEWRRKLPKVLFESGGNGVDIEVGVRDVEVVAAFKAFFDSLDLGVPTRFAVDAFDVHSYRPVLMKDMIMEQRQENIPLASTSCMQRITIPGMLARSYSARCSSSEPNKAACRINETKPYWWDFEGSYLDHLRD